MPRRVRLWFWARVIGVAGQLLGLGPPASLAFRDDFDGSELDPAIWSVDAGSGEVVVSDGFVILSCSGTTFPVVTTRLDPFPAGDFQVRVGIRYLTINTCGDGFGAMDNFWEDYWTGTVCRPFLLWEDSGGLYAYSGSAGDTWHVPAPETAYHVYEWSYADGVYRFSMDGVIRASGDCAPRPTSLFFGHPHPIGCAPWTSFAIDFVEVLPAGVTSASRTSWGAVKQIYR